VGLVLIGMLFCSMILLGLWQRRRSKRLFKNATKKLKELDSKLNEDPDQK